MIHSDQTGKKCTRCKEGTYQEAFVQDEAEGVLHCTVCRKRVPKYKKVEDIQDSRLTLKD